MLSLETLQREHPHRLSVGVRGQLPVSRIAQEIGEALRRRHSFDAKEKVQILPERAQFADRGRSAENRRAVMQHPAKWRLFPALHCLE